MRSTRSALPCSLVWQPEMLFSPTIGAAITTGYWFLWVRCPACRTANAIDLRTLDRHRDAAVTSLIPAMSLMSAERALRRAHPIVADLHRRRNARRVPAASARELNWEGCDFDDLR